MEESLNKDPFLYPATKRRRKSATVTGDHLLTEGGRLPPISGCYEAELDKQVKLELKLDVDKIRDHSPILNIISGSVINTGGHHTSINLNEQEGLHFRSIDGTIRVNSGGRGPNNETQVVCDTHTTRSDGEKSRGKFQLQFRLPQDVAYWEGNVTIEVDDKSISFERLKKITSFFRLVNIDVDYLDRLVWPSIALSDFHDTQEFLKDRKLDVLSAFEDAGVKLNYEQQCSDKIDDPTPHNPWTKADMYDVMMTNFDHVDDNENIWCMIAIKPPDERYMGFSFDKNGKRGFGMFLGHKSFAGLLDTSSENFPYASRRFLHYFVHECGHTLGLVHPFEIGKPNDITWMNYPWKYDQINGPGMFYKDFTYSFTKNELIILRHSPSKGFNSLKTSIEVASPYKRIKSLPTYKHLEDDHSEEDDLHQVSMKIKIREEPYKVGDLVELEIRLKNEGNVVTLIDSDLTVECGNVNMYVSYPDGTLKQLRTFVRPIIGLAQSKPVALFPVADDEDSDRYSQLITVGEGENGSVFCQAGKYILQATYVGDQVQSVSNTLELTVVEPDEEDVDKQSANVACVLGGIGHSTSQLNEWRKYFVMEVEKKKLNTYKIIAAVDEVVKSEIRSASVSTQMIGRRKKKKIEAKKPDISHHDFLDVTEDLVQYYHNQGTKADNMQYKQLVFVRGKLNLKGNADKAYVEYNQLMADLAERGVKHFVIKYISDEWKSMEISEIKEDKTTSEYLQKRVDEILDWYPKKKLEGQNDLSGVGLGTILSQFQNEHVAATAKISALLFNKLDETNDLNDVLDYADNLQKTYLVSHQFLQWAMEIFIIHSRLAKKSGILYPLPRDRDQSLSHDAAMIVTDRSGFPDESWMNYWRCDADLNYHHRHWHSVYVVGREVGVNNDWFGRWRERLPELERQGELFGYMHSQMLARYDAERESWGLRPVREWNYNERDQRGFNSGFEFHNDPRNAGVSHRPPASWPIRTQQTFRRWENAYLDAVENGFLPPVEIASSSRRLRFNLDINLSGHVLEPSSTVWNRWTGSIHNAGHGVFGSNRVPGGSSYMSSTVTAMRDPIFYRWHKRIDNLWQRWNDTQVTELADDAPPVLIRSNDILISRSETPMNNFESFGSDQLRSDEMRTQLDVPLKRYEWDNKISHEPFYYHLRFRRLDMPGDLNLTFRVFICPAVHVNDRKRWIEMDKFVFTLEDGRETAMIIRPDRHSSVIKRNPREMEGNIESDITVVPGFCECGWPYSMLLPRGTTEGEEWRLCVFISNNDIDRIGVRSSCGSMSFCGASGQQYPDRRPMGYPFTTNVSVQAQEVSITDAITFLPNTAMTQFIIRNNVTVSGTIASTDVWSPWTQLGQDDGTNERSSEVTAYGLSRIVGRMRVLIDDDAMYMANRRGLVRVRFQGRGPGNGSYQLSQATIGTRSGTTLNLAPGTPVPTLTVSGQSTFNVPEGGVITDEVQIRPGTPGVNDLFVTFTLESPGCFLRGSRGQPTSTWIIFNPSGDSATTNDWNTLSDVRVSSSVYCVVGVMTSIPP